jgi:hypothetical protein
MEQESRWSAAVMTTRLFEPQRRSAYSSSQRAAKTICTCSAPRPSRAGPCPCVALKPGSGRALTTYIYEANDAGVTTNLLNRRLKQRLAT